MIAFRIILGERSRRLAAAGWLAAPVSAAPYAATVLLCLLLAGCTSHLRPSVEDALAAGKAPAHARALLARWSADTAPRKDRIEARRLARELVAPTINTANRDPTLGARLYHRLLDTKTFEAAMMVGKAYERGWLESDREADSLARHYYRHAAAIVFLHDPPDTRDLDAVGAGFTSGPFRSAWRQVRAHRPWAESLRTSQFAKRYALAVHFWFGIDVPRNTALAELIGRLPPRSFGNAETRHRWANLHRLGVTSSRSSEGLKGATVSAARDGHATSAYQAGLMHLRADKPIEALAWFIVAATLGGPVDPTTIRRLEDQFAESERSDAVQQSQRILLQIPTEAAEIIR